MVDNRLLARLLRSTGGKLLDGAAGKLFPAEGSGKGGGGAKGGFAKAIAGAAISRIATKSVPGALVVGGGILAKLLYDKRRARKGPGDAAS